MSAVDPFLHLKAFILGVVEGLTEFLPVSSTGHLIIAGHWLEFNSGRATSFEVFIQLGAILSVCWYYRARLAAVLRGIGRDSESNLFVGNLAISFLPAAAVGFFAHGYIKTALFRPEVVAWALIVGGVVILGVERLVGNTPVVLASNIRRRQALGIGIAQILALVPGVSRSGATILGGMVCGLDRRAATEYSFFLAIPMMIAATTYDLAKSWGSLQPSDASVFAVGFITAFFSALVAIRFLVRFVSRHSFAAFAWYRILFGASLLAWGGLR
jgi:undecaprenyl-diphosphatase